MFDGNETCASALCASAEGVHSVTHVLHVKGVKRAEGFECGGEDLRWEGDLGFARREGVYTPSGGLVERDRETVLDFALPEKFEDLIRVGGKCESSRGSGAVFGHNSFVIVHRDGVVLLDTVDENLADP